MRGNNTTPPIHVGLAQHHKTGRGRSLSQNADDRKSTSGGCFYVGNNLISWISKKQKSISLSNTEVEYITANSCCTQLLWMQNLFHDYGICQEHFTIYCDNTSAINISKNLVQHSQTKHIEIQHYFIRELAKMVLSLLSLFTLMIKRLICSLNL